MFEFHISREARDRYDFDRSIYQLTGNAIIADFGAARAFANRINRQRDLIEFPDSAVSSGDILAMGLIDEILHVIVADYRERVNPRLMEEALARLGESLGADEIDKALRLFTERFPPVHVYQGERTVDDYLAEQTGALTHRETAVEELLMLWLANANPAFARHIELFDDAQLEAQTAYPRMIEALDQFFRDQPGYGPAGESLVDILLAPAREHPHSLEHQLAFLRSRFPEILARYERRYLRSIDLLREGLRPDFAGPGVIKPTDFHSLGLSEEIERFSSDRDWMPSLVLVAKNAYVWLDQLSKQHRRDIQRLDQVPDEALQQLARWGFSGLWLIGLWERSPASRTIKNLTGNPDAAASAYSLFDYEIANDLGGDPAYENLRERAHRAGLRLAADMVPNHTGIYSKWIIEHPDWYISRPDSPYPVYTFEGADLSSHPEIGIYIEDHYYSRTDAAVVFKRHDRRSGDVRYIYHGNDGTAMPWNDTAQLDYLNPEVREAVIRTILEVARKFSVIRFDAAMTLAKKHIQRLWYPEPGQGGAIPSRSEFSLTRSELEKAIPREFWREVVDRVAEEAPDTLLLAEAFWLMEGYFVRTLGMHRVYNSAFMNMLRDEKNAEYRQVVKNTLAFDPQILKRYVNFMNNPDEETAIEQFGDGGKYFGVCTLMATMPGLPMFGHGQVEGFGEKYGMEYRRAYRAETPNRELIDRHNREIAPLLFRRSVFAEVDNFLFYDFKTGSGSVNEDVFAYSNLSAGKASLVLYHNRWGETSGRIDQSCEYAVKDGAGDSASAARTLAEGLGLPDDPSAFVHFREMGSGLEFIRSCTDLHRDGFQFQLGAYETRVFLDFQVIQETEAELYRTLADRLAGEGTPSLDKLKLEIELEPVHAPFRALLERDVVDATRETGEPVGENAFQVQLEALEAAVQERMGAENGAAGREHNPVDMLKNAAADESMGDVSAADWAVLAAWAVLVHLGQGFGPEARPLELWLDEWMFRDILRDAFSAWDADPSESAALVTLFTERNAQDWFEDTLHASAESWIADAEIARFLNVNRYEEVVWFDTDRFERLVHLLGLIIRLSAPEDSGERGARLAQLAGIEAAAQEAGHRIDRLLDSLRQTPERPPPRQPRDSPADETPPN